MKALIMRAAVAIAIACPAFAAFAQDLEKLPPPATTLYRQVLPDGRVVYSDEPVKGGRIEHTIKVEPPIKGNPWTADSAGKPVAPPKATSTPVRRVNPPAAQRKSLEQASADVVRAEMRLEDAKKRQEAGVVPMEGERSGTASGGSRLNEEYQVRQKWLAREVAQAEADLKEAIRERDAATSVR
jgi:hypothetical protein